MAKKWKSKLATVTQQMLHWDGMPAAGCGPRCPNCGVRPMTRRGWCLSCGEGSSRTLVELGHGEDQKLA